MRRRGGGRTSILMDLVMPRLDGVGAMRELRRRLPSARVIVLTSFADDDRLLPAIRAGAAGYLLKDAEPSGGRQGGPRRAPLARRCSTPRSRLGSSTRSQSRRAPNPQTG